MASVSVSGDIQFNAAAIQGDVQFAVPAWQGDIQFTVMPGFSLGGILRDLSLRVGLIDADFDYSAATQQVDGFLISSRSSVRDIIGVLLQCYFCDLAEIDGKVVAVNRGGSSGATIPAGDLGAFIYASGSTSSVTARLEITRKQDVELPRRVDLTYFSNDSIYQQSTQGASRQAVDTSEEVVTVNTPLTLSDTQARQIAEALLYDAWAQRTGYKFFLPPKYLRLAPADVITLPAADGDKLARITSVEVAPFGAIALNAVFDDPSVLTQIADGAGPQNGGPTIWTSGNTTLIAWSGMALRDADEATYGAYVAASGDGANWTGCSIYSSKDGGTTWQREFTARRAVIGETETALADGVSVGVWDEISTVTVHLFSGTLANTSDAEVIAGANTALIGNEVVGFGTVEDLEGGHYTLSHLWRGLRDTHYTWIDHEAVEAFALLNMTTIGRIVVPDSFLGQTLGIKGVSEGQTVDDVTATWVVIEAPVSSS